MYGRSPAARAPFRQHSTALQQRPRPQAVVVAAARRSNKPPRTVEHPGREIARLERENRKLQATVNRLEQEVERLHIVEAQYHRLLTERIQLDMKIARLEVDLVQYGGYTRTIRDERPEDHVN